jgi:hypothetical protein
MSSIMMCQEVQKRKYVRVAARKYETNADGNKMCLHCDYSTKKQSTMSMHMSNNHAALEGREENPHKCEKCGEGFSATTKLQHHMKNHHNIKFLACPSAGCDYQTAKNTVSLYGHYVRHHMASEMMGCIEKGECYGCGAVKKTGILYHLAICNENSPFCKK